MKHSSPTSDHRWWAAAILLLALVAGCGSDDGSAAAEPGASRGPGTALGDGFTVAEGSELLGRVFPTAEGWEAELLVDGAAGEVLDRYREQAAAAGTPLLAATSTCDATDELLSCTAQGYDDGEGIQGREVTLSLHQGHVADEPVSHLGIAVRSGTVRRPDDRQAAPPFGDLDGPGRPGDWPDRPGVGDEVPGPYPPSARPIEVVPGSTLVAGPHLSAQGSGGLTAVFRVDGDPREVLDAYAAQLADLAHSPDVPQVTTEELGGATLLTAAVGPRGEGASGSARVATDGRSWLLLSLFL